MSENSKIEWCDKTASPWHGCTKVNEGCRNCYAERQSVRNPGTLGVWGPGGTRVKSKSFVAKLRKWNEQAEAAGKPVTVFPSICDPFEDRPELVPWRQEMFAVIDECPWVTLLLLTKRPENIRRMWPGCQVSSLPGDPLATYHHYPHRANVWLGTSFSDQETADKALPHLLKCRDLAPVLFGSYEPAIGPVDLERVSWRLDTGGFVVGSVLGNSDGRSFSPRAAAGIGLSWLIVGGESGPAARTCRQTWIQDTVRQCRDAGVACFVKQFGSNAEDGHGCHRKLLLSDPKGGDPTEWPAGDWPRQFPQLEHAAN